MDSSTNLSSSDRQERKDSSWGAIISILLILGLIVFGAYYAFTDRLSAVENATALR